MEYLSFEEKVITDFSAENITREYNSGFVFTRKGRGIMQRTRSVRINLDRLELSSENKRILKKTSDVRLIEPATPLPYDKYDWKIGKMGKDFYENKFGTKIMSANKIRSMLSDEFEQEENFNSLLEYTQNDLGIGYTICYENANILHYSYPFYDLIHMPNKDMGLGMMIRAIEYAKKDNKKYIYLGSLQRPSDTYKLQFSGIEWFDGKEWQTDTEKVKIILNDK